jgi:hypothetical protein
MTNARSSSGLSGRSTVPNSIPSLPRRRVSGATSQDNDDQYDNFPLAPHLAESSKKRAASDGKRPARKVHVRYDRDNSMGSSRLQVAIVEPNDILAWLTRIKSSPAPSLQNAQHDPLRFNDSPRLDSDLCSIEEGPNEAEAIVERPSRVGPRSRSFFQVPDKYKDLTARAAAHVRHYTFFENPMLNADEIAQLLTESWADAQKERGETLERIKVVDAHVSDIPYRSRRKMS